MATANCDSCEESHLQYLEEGYDVVLDCASCFPGVHRYNEAEYKVYSECSNQFITGPSGVIELNILAIDSVMSDFGISSGEDRIEVRRAVLKLSNKVRAIKKANTK